MADQDRPRKPKWLRPRLALLLFGVLLCALALTWFSDQARRRGAPISATKRAGGYVILDDDHLPLQAGPWLTGKGSQLTARQPSPPARPPSLTLMAEQLGPGFAHRVTLINLDAKPVRDDDLKALAGVASLRILYLNATPITDQSLVHLSGLSGLRKLELRETKIGDAGMAHLSTLRELQALYLHSTKIGDQGMAHLRGLAKLRELHLGRTGVGDIGLRELKDLRALEALYLEHTNVTDRGLASLESMPNLQYVNLDGTRVSNQAVARLRNTRPGLMIVHNGSIMLPTGPSARPKPSPSAAESDGLGLEGELRRDEYAVS